MNSLPAGWIQTTFGQIAEVRLGRQRSPKTHSGWNMRPYLRAANVKWEGLALQDVKEMHFEPTEVETYKLAPGDVVVAEASGSRDQVGKPAIWRGEITDCCFQNTLLRVRSRGPLPEYLLHYLRAEAAAGRLGEAARGVGIHHLGAAGLSEYPIRLPPLAEQRGIVAAIEEQLSRLDAAKQLLDSSRWKVTRLRRSLIAEVANGDWSEKTVGDVASLCDGPFGSNLKTSHYVESGPRVVRLQNIGEGYFRDEKAHIGEKHFETLAKHAVRPGDVVVASLGDEAPRACLIPSWLGPAIVKADCVRLRVTAEVEPAFLMWVLNSEPVRAQAAKRIRGIGRPRLGLGGIRDLVIAVPPREEQRRLVSRIERCISILGALQLSMERAVIRGDQLRHGLLGLAFSGRLLPQDPTDEPALALMTRTGRPRQMQPNLDGGD